MTQLATKLQRFARGHFVHSGLPLFAFVVVGWVGISQLMESKLKIRSELRGYDKVEEYDPMDRLKHYGETTQPKAVKYATIEDELKELEQKGLYEEFEYKAVPRTDEEE